jgi:hypothetical protein
MCGSVNAKRMVREVGEAIWIFAHYLPMAYQELLAILT